MRRAQGIKSELAQIGTVEDLANVFEGIASLHIARIRDRVVTSKAFFGELWQTYLGLRVDPGDRLQRSSQAKRAGDVYVAITAEGKLGGEIDEQIIEQMLAASAQLQKPDIVVVGRQGAVQLTRRGVGATKFFHLPESDVNLNLGEMINVLNGYNRIVVFYQTYESLRVQKVARIELLSAIRELSEDVAKDTEIISSRDYIFEPNLSEIIDYMESIMMEVALLQVVMESKLAQYAGRFNSMNRAKHRATDLTLDYKRQYYHAKRSEVDERLKEVMRVVRYGSRWTN